MMRLALAVAALALSAEAAAQVFPTPGEATPRIQTARWQAGQAIVLTAIPETALTVMLEPGEAITRATLQGLNQWEVTISAESDALQVRPQAGASPARLLVETDRRDYEFALEVGQGLLTAYLVKLEFDAQEPALVEATKPEETPAAISDLNWSYKVRGDRSVRPAAIRDDGSRTVIEYAPGQPLPAVFAIGATGKEEVVDGYMRNDLFVIDRVHQKLVFRIDKKKATAKRNDEQDNQP